MSHYTYMDSPVGRLLLLGTGSALTGIEFVASERAQGPEPDARADAGPFAEATRQLEAYFARDLRRFDLSLEPHGTSFQRLTWDALRRIPYGETRTYSEIACDIGRPNAVRAVGAANGSNPLPIVIPCHRVIGAGGDLTGFGGGLDKKRFLLSLEGTLTDRLFG